MILKLEVFCECLKDVDGKRDDLFCISKCDWLIECGFWIREGMRKREIKF